MREGRAQARLRSTHAHQEQVLLQQAREINTGGALRAGTEIRLVKNEDKHEEDKWFAAVP